MNKFLNRFLILCLLGSTPGFAEEEHEEEEGGIPPMTIEQRQAMGILTQVVGTQIVADEVVVPGEVTVNRYHTTEVTPRISAQITQRHARMGQQVKKGQKLVTLSSVEMAEAQGQLLIADREWQRVQKLGRQVVSEKRFVAAQVEHQQAAEEMPRAQRAHPGLRERLRHRAAFLPRPGSRGSGVGAGCGPDPGVRRDP